MENENVRLMLVDVVEELLERAKHSRLTIAQSGSDYSRGYSYALYEVISLMQQQAQAFGIDRIAIGLEDVDPERDLLVR